MRRHHIKRDANVIRIESWYAARDWEADEYRNLNPIAMVLCLALIEIIVVGWLVWWL